MYSAATKITPRKRPGMDLTHHINNSIKNYRKGNTMHNRQIDQGITSENVHWWKNTQGKYLADIPTVGLTQHDSFDEFITNLYQHGYKDSARQINKEVKTDVSTTI